MPWPYMVTMVLISYVGGGVEQEFNTFDRMDLCFAEVTLPHLSIATSNFPPLVIQLELLSEEHLVHSSTKASGAWCPMMAWEGLGPSRATLVWVWASIAWTRTLLSGSHAYYASAAQGIEDWSFPLADLITHSMLHCVVTFIFKVSLCDVYCWILSVLIPAVHPLLLR